MLAGVVSLFISSNITRPIAESEAGSTALRGMAIWIIV
jgi:hypothetical protein